MLTAFLHIGSDQIGQIFIGVVLCILGYVQKKWKKEYQEKQEQIHILVNSRLTAALETIKRLQEQIKDLEEADECKDLPQPVKDSTVPTIIVVPEASTKSNGS